ncbi:MAG: hypothetical protein M3N50_14170 [Pseudomonadota bacterium]|nr:hypothetical protein [Pseudomonadota bacterium]
MKFSTFNRASGVRAAQVLATAALSLLTWPLLAGADTPPAIAAQPRAARSAAMPDDFSGAWVHDMSSGNLPQRGSPDQKKFTLGDGTVIPIRPEAEKVYRQRVAMGMTDRPFANTASRCLPIGTPGNMMGAPYPLQIVQRPDFIAILLEEGGQFRAIYMNGKHPDEVIPSFLGHSIGHWEGKTLVIETVAMREETTLDFNGLPHSAQMRVIERIKRTAPTKLVDEIEIDDPATYFKPFTMTSVFTKTAEEMIEYICEDTRMRATPDGRQDYSFPK